MAKVNIMRLPTAAKRQVQQPAGFALTRAASELPQHPATWKDHGGGKNYLQSTFQRSPEMMVAAAILKVLSEDQKDRVRRYIATMADLSGSPHAPTALAIVERIK